MVKECFDEALTELKTFSKDELQEFSQRVMKRAREIDPRSGTKAINQALEEVGGEFKEEYFNDAQNKAQDIKKLDANEAKIRSGKADLKSIVIKRNKNLADNIEAYQQTEKQILSDVVFRPDITTEEMKYLQDTRNEEDVTAAIDGDTSRNPAAQKWASIINEYMQIRDAKLLSSGALSLRDFKKGHTLKAVHDESKIMTGDRSYLKMAMDMEYKPKVAIEDQKAIWRDQEIMPHIDYEETFNTTTAADAEGHIDDGKADKIVDKIFDDITTGKADIQTSVISVRDRQAVQRRGQQFFVFKSVSDLNTYNRRNGTGDFFSLLLNDMRTSANKIGMANLMGTSPDSHFNDLRKVQQEVPNKNGKARGRTYFAAADLYYKTAKGQDRIVASPTVAAIEDNTIAVTSIARLPLVVPMSTGDLGFIAAHQVRTGGGIDSLVRVATRVFGVYKNEELRYIAKTTKTLLDPMMGASGRWVDQNNTSSMLKKFSTAYFRFNLLHAWDTGNKQGAIELCMSRVFRARKTEWDKLDPAQRNWLSKFIEPDEWDALRKQEQPVKLLTADSALKISNEDLEAVQERTGKSFGDIRNDLYRKVFQMYAANSENAVMNPLSFERSITHWGLPKGFAVATPLRLITQFKQFGIAFVDRGLANGFDDAKESGKLPQWALAMFVGTMPYAILGGMLEEILKGSWVNPIKQWEESNVTERTNLVSNWMLGSIAQYLGILDPKNQNSNMAIDLLNSPSIRFISNSVAAALSGVRAGLTRTEKDTKNFKKNFKKAASYMAPLQNVPAAQPYIDKALDQKSYHEKGAVQLWGQ